MEIRHKNDVEPMFYSVDQTAQLLGVSHKTVYRLLDRKLLKANPHLRRKLITGTSIRSFAAAV